MKISAEGKDLFRYIRNNFPDGLNEDQARIIFSQILKSLEYIHEHDMVHRDLKVNLIH